MTTSNSSEPVGTSTGAAAASAGQMSAPETTTPTTGTTLPATTPDATKQAAGTTPDPLASATPDGVTPPVVPPAYTPNFKYKAFGKELELDEFWRPLVKDADSEKKVKDLFTKTMAFDDLKARHDTTQGEFQGLLADHQALDKDVRRVMKFLNADDFDNFLGALRIPEEKIFNWVEKKLALAQMTPEQRTAYESQARERAKAYDLEQEKGDLEQRFEAQEVQARTMQLELALLQPSAQQAASAWDTKMGAVGAFRDLIIQEGLSHFHATGKDLTPEQAVAQVLQKYGKLLESGQGPQVPVPQAPDATTPAPQMQTKPIIPAVQGRGTSPVKKSPKSIDDLKQLGRELEAAGQ